MIGGDITHIFEVQEIKNADAGNKVDKDFELLLFDDRQKGPQLDVGDQIGVSLPSAMVNGQRSRLTLRSEAAFSYEAKLFLLKLSGCLPGHKNVIALTPIREPNRDIYHVTKDVFVFDDGLAGM